MSRNILRMPITNRDPASSPKVNRLNCIACCSFQFCNTFSVWTDTRRTNVFSVYDLFHNAWWCRLCSWSLNSLLQPHSHFLQKHCYYRTLENHISTDVRKKGIQVGPKGNKKDGIFMEYQLTFQLFFLLIGLSRICVFDLCDHYKTG